MQDIIADLGSRPANGSRLMPRLRQDQYGCLHLTLLQFNARLLQAYQDGALRIS